MIKQTFTRNQVLDILNDLLESPDILLDATQNEDTPYDAATLLDVAEDRLSMAMNPITGVELIAEERTRQVEVEGFTSEHDDQHKGGQLQILAMLYCCPLEYRPMLLRTSLFKTMGFDIEWFKPTARAHELVKAGALIAAEIDRLFRQSREMMARNKEERTKVFQEILEISKSGYAGISSSGQIVDRREHPEAIPIQRNPLFDVPKPKELQKPNRLTQE